MDSPTTINSSENSSDRYKPLELEPKWQKDWLQKEINRTPSPKPNQRKFYALSMFPYPSGNLHMGHVRNYVITDVIARIQRMRGDAVLHPMGWDAFGLPAENAAIERNIDPGDWTNKNIAHMKQQLNRLGLSIDWDREQTTCHQDYYKWTQYLFLELYASGLAYRKKASVNWDPIDKTVLANEQVDSDGRSWRSGAIVEKRELEQWFLKITDYANDLLKDLNELKEWPTRVRTMQSNWIGKSEGTVIEFALTSDHDLKIKVFTTRLDTLFGVSYIALAPENKLAEKLLDPKYKDKFTAYKNKVDKLSVIERTEDTANKSGFAIGAEVINPINGEVIPVWVADYVLEEYGSGAVMGVPAHDERDYKFASKYQLNIKTVIKESVESETTDNCYTSKNGILINSGKYSGLNTTLAKAELLIQAKKEGWGKEKIQYKLRDWLISRQRYWGCPIPIIHCPSCGDVDVPKEDLPVKLPKGINLSGKGLSALSGIDEWKLVNCPKCGKKAERETDTMDTFMCSSWYFLRFADHNNCSIPFSKSKINEWLPVNQYVGGVEHAILHLLYARFLTKALNKRNLIDIKEPFEKLLTQGMVQGITYKNVITGKYISEDLLDKNSKLYDPNTGDKLEVIYEKMSKSKYNGVDPSIVINRYGADTARMFILFKAPPEKDLEWDDADVEGQFRFLQRLWRLVNDYKLKEIDKEFNINIKTKNLTKPKAITNKEKELRRIIHSSIQSISEDIDKRLQFNTAISELMKLSNSMHENINHVSIPIASEAFSTLIRLLAPFSPHIAEEFWHSLGGTDSVHQQPWPLCDHQALVQEEYKLIIQINGKVRGATMVATDTPKEDLEQIAINSDLAKKWIKENSIKRTIVVPGRLVNIVL